MVAFASGTASISTYHRAGRKHADSAINLPALFTSRLKLPIQHGS